MSADLRKVTGLKEIAQYNVFATPGLVINGKVKASGRVPSLEDIKKWVTEEQ